MTSLETVEAVDVSGCVAMGSNLKANKARGGRIAKAIQTTSNDAWHLNLSSAVVR